MRSVEVNYTIAKILLNEALQPPLRMFEKAGDRPVLEPTNEQYIGNEVLLPTGAKLVCLSEMKRRKKVYRFLVHGYALDDRDLTELGLSRELIASKWPPLNNDD